MYIIYIFDNSFNNLLGRCCFAHFTGGEKKKKNLTHRKKKQFVQDHTDSKCEMVVLEPKIQSCLLNVSVS